MTERNDDTFDFEASLQELEALVSRMERGELTLEESLRSFERGIELTRACQGALNRAEQKVEILLAADENSPTVPFEPEHGDDA